MAGYVLVVDDEAGFQSFLHTLLDYLGHRCVVCENGRDALTRLRQDGPPALILLDLTMPGMNGWEFLEELARNPVWLPIPVAILSASEPGPLPVRPVAVLTKPVDLGKLLAVVSEYCDVS